VLDTLWNLVNRSLVVAEQLSIGTRYRMLETITEYSHRRFCYAGEAKAALHRRHADYYLRLAEQAEPELHRADQADWLERLEAERDNLHAAIAWLHADADGGEAELKLTAALMDFWYRRCYIVPGRVALEQALERNAGADDTLRAKALIAIGCLTWRQGDNDAAYDYFSRALEILCSGTNERHIAIVLYNLGNVALDRNDIPRAQALLQESLARRRKLGDRRGIASALNSLGHIASLQKDNVLQRRLLEESLALRHELGDRQGIASVSFNLADVCCREHDYAGARALYIASLKGWQEIGDSDGIAHVLTSYGYLLAETGQEAMAIRLLAAADALRTTIGVPIKGANAAAHAEVLATLHARLTEDAFAAARAEGAAMPLAQAVDLILAVAPDSVPRER
jgi:tetratricopeptide (TPR) repeat protein